MTRPDAPMHITRKRPGRVARGRILACLVATLAIGYCSAPASSSDRPPMPARIVVLSTSQGTYQQAAAAAEAALAQAGYQVTSIKLPRGARVQLSSKGPSTSGAQAPFTDNQALAEVQRSVQQVSAAAPAAILAVGDEATSVALETQPGTPVVFCTIPNILDMPFLASNYPGRDRLAGVSADIDPARQIEWVTAMVPRTRKLCVLCSSHSSRTAGAIEAAGKARGVEISLVDARQDQFGSALQALEQQHCDGVIMIADADIYNAASVRELLLWGLRSKKAVWSFAPNIVAAGALGGQYIEAPAIGRQAADVVKRVVEGTRISDIGVQYPDVIRTAVNQRTAEMIGVTLEERSLGSVTVRYPDKQ